LALSQRLNVKYFIMIGNNYLCFSVKICVLNNLRKKL